MRNRVIILLLLPIVYLIVHSMLKAADCRRASVVIGAAERGEVHELRKLLRKDPSLANARNGLNETPLHRAAKSGSSQAISLLLEYKANRNAVDKSGKTPLDVAADHGRIAVARILLANRAKPGEDDHTVSALDRALKAGMGDMAGLLYKYEGQGLKLHEAAALGDVSLIKTLARKDRRYITCTDMRGRTPLHVAASVDQAEAARALLHAGSDVNAPECSGITPLHMAIDRGDVRMAKLLLDSGAYPNAGSGSAAGTPLLRAVKGGQMKLARLLLDRGVSPNVADNCGCTPLHAASGTGDEAIVKLLLAFKANPNLPDDQGFTPLHTAVNCRRSVVSQLLVSNGADPNVRIGNGKTTLTLAKQNNDRTLQNFLRRHVGK